MELGVPFISSIPNSSTPPAFFQYHPQPTIISRSIFSLDQIIMASQKMALLAVAAGLLCMSALLNGAETSCGGFTASCQEPFSVTGSVVSANCANDAGDFASSSLDLNPFLSNDNGNLVEGGDYIATCTPEGFGLFGSPFYINANCAQENGNVVRTSYNINNNVSNDNGVLAWHTC